AHHEHPVVVSAARSNCSRNARSDVGGRVEALQRAVAEGEPTVKKKSGKNERHEYRPVRINRAVRRPDDGFLASPLCHCHRYFLPTEAASFPARACLASLISSSSLSNASGVSLWPAARGRNTFTRSKRTPRISARDGSLADPLRISLRITSRIHSPRASPCDLANSVTFPNSSFVSFAVTGKTRFRAWSVSEMACAESFKIAMFPRISQVHPSAPETVMYLKTL